MNTKAAARITGYSDRHIRRAIASGDLPASGSGHKRDIDHDDLIKWCKNHNTKRGPKFTTQPLANSSVSM